LTFLLIVLLSASLLVSSCSSKQQANKETEQAVSAVNVEKRDITKNVRYSGILRGSNETAIIPKVSARVTAIYVKPGDVVSAGQTLLTLDTKDYEAALGIAWAGVEVAQANKRSADVSLEQARIAYERAKTLHDAGANSDQDLEKAQADYDKAAAGYYDAALAQAQANLEQAQTNIGHCTLTSPISGVVGNVALSLGENSSTSTAAVVITNSDELEANVLVSESEISYVKEADQVKVLVKAVDSLPFTGKVVSISTVPDPAKKNFTVKVALPNQDSRIRSGMFAEVSVNTQSKSGVPVVPVNAVIPRSGRMLVYVVDENNRAKEIDVEIGLKNDEYVEILKGLTEGQMVITKGNTIVQNGSLVKVIAGGAK
ncbi:MAG: efflux RND transporter periplasmic adaptor subunit, partial [Syntrophomonas sp.]